MVNRRGKVASGWGVRACAAGMLVVVGSAIAVTSVDAWAQSSRRTGARAKDKPKEEPLPLTYADDVARCSVPYHAALQGLLAVNPRPLATALAIRKPLPQLSGRWVFHLSGERRRERDASGRRVEGNQVCAEETQRAGRSRCLRWEPLTPQRVSTVPTPPPSREEAKLLTFIAEFVANKGAPPEFLGNGRYTVLTERVGSDLESYLTQPQHPALCAGGTEFAEFLIDKLGIFLKRAADVRDMQGKARVLAGMRLAALRAALKPPPVAVAAGPVAGDAVAAPQEAPKPPDVKPQAIDVASAIRETAQLVLVASAADAIAGEPSPDAALSRFAAALNSDTESTATDTARALARATLRVAEASHYVDLLAARYVELEQALKGNLEGVRKAHAEACTCGP